MEQRLPTPALCLPKHEISPEEPSGHVATHQRSFLFSLGNLIRSKGQLSPATPEDSEEADRPQPAPRPRATLLPIPPGGKAGLLLHGRSSEPLADS